MAADLHLVPLHKIHQNEERLTRLRYYQPSQCDRSLISGNYQLQE